MPVIQKTISVYRCDRCPAETDEESKFSVFAAGTRLGSTTFATEEMLCPDCVTAVLGSPTKIKLGIDEDSPVIRELLRIERERRVKAEQELERARAARDRAYDSGYASGSSDRGSSSGGGATGRPFATQSGLSRTASPDWYTLQPSSGSLPACDRGLGKSRSVSGARSGLLGRLLSCQTPAT